VKTIVVFGDSHAQMWMPTILRMAHWDGWVVIPLVKVGCVPRAWTRQAGCRAWVAWAKRQAAALRPEVTLIAGSWGGTATPDPDVRAGRRAEHRAEARLGHGRGRRRRAAPAPDAGRVLARLGRDDADLHDEGAARVVASGRARRRELQEEPDRLHPHPRLVRR
jgi:hypothetical protein